VCVFVRILIDSEMSSLLAQHIA